MPAEHVEAPGVAPEDARNHAAGPTGDAAVDRVIASLDVLDGLDLSGHVAVYERAHDDLRAVMDGAGA